jgi:hypothetical protein
MSAQGERSAPSETDRLEASIDGTRRRVARDVDAIADRLRPSSIKHELVVQLERRAFTAVATLRKRPALALAVLGAGVLLLLWRARVRHAS